MTPDPYECSGFMSDVFAREHHDAVAASPYDERDRPGHLEDVPTRAELEADDA